MTMNLKRRLPSVIAQKTNETYAQLTNGLEGEVVYVSGSGGQYLAVYDGITAGPSIRVARCNISAAGPTTDDDIHRGYSYFSQWINTSAEDIYSCVDPTSGAAIWVRLNA